MIGRILLYCLRFLSPRCTFPVKFPGLGRLWIEPLRLLYVWWAWSNHMRSLKTEGFFPRCRKRKSETHTSDGLEENNYPCWKLLIQKGVEGSPHLIASSMKTPQFYNSKEINSTLLTPWFQPCETLSGELSHAVLGFYLQNCELINRCCLKLLSLWEFVMQQEKTDTCR